MTLMFSHWLSVREPIPERPWSVFFLSLPHHNKQGYTSEGKTLSLHVFAFGELPRPKLTSPFCFSKHEKVKEMCCHGYMVCRLCSHKNTCIAPSFVSVLRIYFRIYMYQKCCHHNLYTYIYIFHTFISCSLACFSSFSSCLWRERAAYST